jgi:hypothetical protein
MVVFGYVLESTIELVITSLLLIFNCWQVYANHLAYRTWRLAASSMDLAANPNGTAIGEVAAAGSLVSKATAARVTPVIRYGHMLMVVMSLLLVLCAVDPEAQLSRLPHAFGFGLYLNSSIIFVVSFHHYLSLPLLHLV